MQGDDLYQRLLDAGYAEDVASQIVASAPNAQQQQQQQADQLSAVRRAGPPHPVVGALLVALIDYLTHLSEQQNVTPGQHPATADLLDELTALRDASAPEDSDAADEGT